MHFDCKALISLDVYIHGLKSDSENIPGSHENLRKNETIGRVKFIALYGYKMIRTTILIYVHKYTRRKNCSLQNTRHTQNVINSTILS